MLASNAVTMRDGGADGTTSAPLVSNEDLEDHPAPSTPYEAKDAAHAGSLIDAAFAACRAVGSGHGVFGDAWMNRLLEVVHPSYGLYFLTHNKPAELARLAHLAKIPFTKATEKNLALLCVQLAARPSYSDQDKLCSDWSSLLRCALEENVTVDAFIRWVGTTTVRDCKKAVAERQRAAKIAAGLAPRKPRVVSPAAGEHDSARLGGGTWQELRLHGADGTTGEMVDLLASIHTAVLDALTSPGSQPERLEQIIESLRALAGELAAEVPEIDPQPEAGEPAPDEAIAEAAND